MFTNQQNMYAMGRKKYEESLLAARREELVKNYKLGSKWDLMMMMMERTGLVESLQALDRV
jgi:hypothetical protein